MEATAVNHIDSFVRSGVYQTPTLFPFIIGRDLARTVVEIGSGVSSHMIGDRVWCNSLVTPAARVLLSNLLSCPRTVVSVAVRHVSRSLQQRTGTS
ncbi:alcohol dehydrogenase catalytic domain-containing protein [Alcaligenaceae bacterium CGII-47]|nr:alcohol dehydrogenase catalytic domain-containing protein [Alcaligenaceae bacterium CGII-47]